MKNKKLSSSEFNSLVERIQKDNNWFDEFIGLVNEYYKYNQVGGSLHIVLDDENLGDNCIDWCAGYACGINDEAGNDIANLMKSMKIKQRKLVVKNYNLYA